MSSRQETFVIVGASLAGARAAATLREEGFDGQVVLLGAEAERPYERPPLSKEFLRGEADDKPYVHEQGFYVEQQIELRLQTRVTELDPRNSRVVLEGGGEIGYDRLLLATGSEPRRLSLPGSDLDGVHYLRQVEDSEAIGARLRSGARLVVIGGGWIGAEVAASARQKGCEVTVLERSALPLEHVLGPEVGSIYRDIHLEHGVRMLTGAELTGFEGDGSVQRVTTGDESIECDFVVVGVGVVPRTQLAEAAGIEVENGVLVDERLRTSAPGVFAAGDLANAQHPFFGRRIRVEHWANALEQGPAAARSMLGRGEPYEKIPYFFSDQYDIGMEYAGFATEWDQVVFRGDTDSREFIAFWVKDGRVLAGMNVNVWEVNDAIQALVRSGASVAPEQLADPDTPLEELISEAGAPADSTRST